MSFNICQIYNSIIECQVPALVKFLVVNIVCMRVRVSSLFSCQVSSDVKFLQLSNFFSNFQLPNFSSLPAFQLSQNLTGGRGARYVVMSSRAWYGENLTPYCEKINNQVC